MANEEKMHAHFKLFECLGKVISARRKRLGLSQEDLAESSGVDRAFISKVEQGKRNPSFGIVANLAHGLRMAYSRLVYNCEQCQQKTDKLP
jgi:transcriptional regulator with XRE-family HTH domain